MKNTPIRPRTVKLIARILKPFVDEGVILVSEEQEILKNLRHLAEKGNLPPSVVPKLIDQRQAAEILGVGYSNFKKLEKDGIFPFKRKMVGAAIRYRSTDVLDFILADSEINEEK